MGSNDWVNVSFPIGGTNQVGQASNERGTKAGKAIYESDLPNSVWTLQPDKKGTPATLNCHHGAVAAPKTTESPKEVVTPKPQYGPLREEVPPQGNPAGDKVWESDALEQLYAINPFLRSATYRANSK